MAKKISKWFRIGVEGDTCDGRVISATDIQEMADGFDPRVYGCRINLEHNLGGNGFTTAVELEVMLSDVEYETDVGVFFAC
ncbi:phage capsid scaffolding protein [Trabulsiella guamensis ATCC 49490]|uniref:Phage capsid scaffolding protein n=1 Tax=Trabulsiella guamensis ATCC 49490 TaxID=1005994 RepID=A0A084ZU14_9ENTR|nr:phage capsid scaffolding protein [Trabulsiella guamensis ATCC 49490]